MSISSTEASDDDQKTDLVRQAPIAPGQFFGDVINGSDHALQELKELIPQLTAWIDSIRLADPAEQAERRNIFNQYVELLKDRVSMARVVRNLNVISLIQSHPSREQLLSSVNPYLAELPSTFANRSKLRDFERHLFEHDGKVMIRLLGDWAIAHKRSVANDIYGLHWALWCEDGILPVGRKAIERRIAELISEGANFSEEAKRRFLECAVFENDETCALVLSIEQGGTICKAFFLADVQENAASRVIRARNEVLFLTSGKRPTATGNRMPVVTAFQKHAEQWWAQFSGQPLSKLGRPFKWSREEFISKIDEYFSSCDRKKPKLQDLAGFLDIELGDWYRYLEVFELPSWKELVRKSKTIY